MKRKSVFQVISAAMSAALLFTSVPVTALSALAEAKTEENVLKLWYDEPVSQGTTILDKGGFGTTDEDNEWQQLSLPIGNSFMGANVYGEIASERLTFNQKTLWNGGPSASRPNYNGGNKTTTSQGKSMAEAYEEVVEAFLAGNDATASTLCNNLTGESSGYGAYQSWGDIYLTFEGLTDTTAVTGYERNLDLTEAVANVDFTADGTDYHREYFVSYPDNVLAMKLTVEGGSRLNFNVSFPVDNGENVSAKKLGKDVNYTVDASNGTIVTVGSMQDNQMKMNSMLQVVTSGQIAANGDGESLDITNAREAVIFVSADTDYANSYPAYRTGETDDELADSVAATVAAAAEKGYDAVKEAHLKDYQELFSRVDLNLGQIDTQKTTDELLAAYKNGSAADGEKRLLEVLLYQYGRYLTVASSREGDLPSNLQGVWQNRVGDANRVPWGSDYHMNVNLQMNYWPTYSANLAECAIPLIDYVDSLREPGRVTAAAYFGITSGEGEANGFTAHTQNTPFGWTCPGWDFSWGWSPAAVPWILQNCWEYYEYTGDVEFMKERIYPMLKEEALLYDQILVDSGVEITCEDGTKSTRLVSVPTYSPEHGPRTLGNAYEQELIWQLYTDVITAAETLGVDEDLTASWKATKNRLAPIEVGSSGQIKEWYNETTLGSVSQFQSGHRHMSHLLGLFPGDLISVDNDTYMDAAITSLSERGMTSTGWGMGQRINSWARTGQGNKAHQLIKNLFSNGIYPNMWDTHSPFQIDGNFGYTSGVNEMLMQSNMGYINILPAIPDVWESGSVDGIVARGNFEIGIDWQNGTPVSVDILSNNGGTCAVQYPAIRSAVVTDSMGNEVETAAISKNRISFESKQGETYTITGFEKEIDPVEKLSKAKWTATAGSEEGQGNDGPASWAIDDNDATLWHSNWSGDASVQADIPNNLRNEFTIDFGETVTFHEFEYVPRSGTSTNGTITSYVIYYSTTADGDDFVKLAEGNWTADKTNKKVSFDGTSMRRLQIRAMATMGEGGADKFISAGEFNAYRINEIPTADDTNLRAAVTAAKEKALDGYTEESAAAFGKALAKAEEVLGWSDASQIEIDQALAALHKAEASLQKKPDEADNKKLQETVTDAKKIDVSGYTKESADVFRRALANAERVLADKNAAQAEIDAALKALTEAKAGLKKIIKPVLPAKGSVIESGNLKFKVTKSAERNGTVAVTGMKKSRTKVTIPATVKKNGYTFKVTSVAKNAFKGNTKLKTVVFASSITSVGAKSFYKCKKLANITFKSTKALKVGSQAFKGIKANCKIYVPKKMKSKQLTTLKKRMKSAGKNVKYKKK